MIPTDFIAEWRSQAPWVASSQVEQDLVISRALVEIFSDDRLAEALAFRGGTALFKLHLTPAPRYSEDIDLVQRNAEPIGPTIDRLRARFSGSSRVSTYALDELLGTKLRALYQRKKGRDLFDLWWASQHATVDFDRVVRCFGDYLGAEGLRVSRAEMEANLAGKLRDRRFFADLRPLLAPGIGWDFEAAVQWISREITPRLEGEPWKGAGGSDDGDA